MRVLVTGASGFIGRYVMRGLNDTEHLALAFPGDVRDESTFPGGCFGAIIHLAAKVDKRFWQSDDLYRVNVEGTGNLLEHYPGSKFIYVSSADVEKEPLSEYAKSKKMAENLVLVNPDNLVIRPPSVFGPRDLHDKLIPRLFGKYLEGRECEVLNNDENEHIYVQDVSNYIVTHMMNRRGIVRLRGFRIRNLNLDAMIRAVCWRETPNLSYEWQSFFNCLRQCLPAIGETGQP